MSIIGIVGEYNPFHSGHEYHIQQSRQALGEDCPVVCVMSGDFVQRGEPAIYSKFARAEAACRCGADLVVELPLPWSLSSAEGFARGAVYLLSKLGVTHLSFGSEAGELEPLETIAQTLLDPAVNGEIRQVLSSDASLPYALARQKALETRLGELANQLELPNNILAVEYLKAIYELRLDMQPMTVLRFGSGHDEEGETGPRSAAQLRRMIRNGDNISAYIPKEAAQVFEREKQQGRAYTDSDMVEAAIISRLRLFGPAYYEQLPDGGDGIGRRLYMAAHEEASLDAITAAAKTKRYALSRIRRMCMCAALGVKAGMAGELPPYARVLAANAKGCALLREISRKGEIPVITKPASVRDLSAECREIFALGAAAHDLYVLGFCAREEKKGGKEWRTSPKIVQE